MRFLQKMQEM